MREIKFRAWDGKEMWTGFHILSRDIIVPPAWRKTRVDLEFMQYTGLHDKNGVEIYEGDVMGSGKKAFYTVVWNSKEAMFCLADSSGNPVHDFDFESYEVIGNIYENKELLK